ncbi:MAG: MinD/ParA family protein [Thermodesulfobacteria bacterium]|nr:MinD/ParA family protein [Thermodesulfobacteriota bacterium]
MFDASLARPFEVSSFPRVFAVSSGKGGVGKTTLAANLAYALSRKGEKVLLFDGDLGLANVDVLFGLTPKCHVGDVLRGHASLREVMIEGPGGMKILPASSGIVDLTQLSEPQKLRLLEEFDALARDFAWVFFDTAAGISENVLYFNLASQERLLLCTPEPTALTDVYALIKVLYRRYGVKRFHLVVNWVQHPRQGEEIFRQLLRVVERFLGSVSLNFLGALPFDQRVSQAVRFQRPFLEIFPHSPWAKALEDLAEQILSLDEAPFDGGLKFFGRKIMGVVA